MPVFGGTGQVEVVNEVQVSLTGLLRDGLVEADGDLTIKINAFYYDVAGLHGKFVGAILQPVVDNDTTFVYLDDNELLQITNVGYPIGLPHLRLARVVAQAGIIVGIADERAYLSVGNDDGFISLEEYADNDASITTPNSAFVEALKLTTTNLPNGTYLISWSFEVLNSQKNGITRTRVQLDDTDDLSFADKTPNGGTEDVCGEVRRVLSGVHTIDIDFFPLTGTTGEVRRRRLNIRRVA